MRWPKLFVILATLVASGCMIPNTYYDPVDPYARGVRWYDRGRYDLAAQSWDPLVEKGDCDAEYWVGMLHFLGRAKPQDNDKAIALWTKAANGSQPKAQGAMGDLHYQNPTFTVHKCANCKVQKDLVQAYIWYQLLGKSARYDGEKNYAKGVLGKITAEMTSEQIAQGDKLVSQWKPEPKDCGARNWW